MLLVITLKANAVAADDCFQKSLCVLRRDHFTDGVAGTCLQAELSLAALLVPVRISLFV
jgi:hypothetical protein